MIFGILQKEWYQHRSLAFFSSLILITTAASFLGMSLLRQVGGSHFYVLSWVLWLLLPLHSMILSNALIADEYRQKTQVFLEGLPLSRFVMLAVKYCLGLGITLATVSVMLALAFALGASSEGMTNRFATLLIAKSFLWAWFSWACMFVFGFLGRYRLVVGVAVLLGLLLINGILDVPFDRLGPFALIGSQFPYERVVVPTETLVQTVLSIAVLTSIGLGFGLARDAELASMLSEKMSSREKFAITALVLGSMAVLSGVSDRIRMSEPLFLPGSIDLEYDHGTISAAAAVAAPSQPELDALAEHAQAAAEQLSELAGYLDIHRMPKLFLVHRGDFEQGKFELGDLNVRQGVLIRLNALKNQPSDLQLRRQVIENVLSARQHRRLESDTRGWVLTGFATWWPVRDQSMDVIDLRASLPSPATDVDANAEMAATEVHADVFSKWLQWSDQAGEEQSRLASSTTMLVLKEINAQAHQDFLKIILGYEAPYDVRASVRDYFHSVRSTLRRTLGIELETLAARVSAELDRHR